MMDHCRYCIRENIFLLKDLESYQRLTLYPPSGIICKKSSLTLVMSIARRYQDAAKTPDANDVFNKQNQSTFPEIRIGVKFMEFRMSSQAAFSKLGLNISIARQCIHRDLDTRPRVIIHIVMYG